ncbi:MAG: 3-deoxy-manno-octulosonate cytidylyltransferase [Sedimentisphaerales bacterium]|nr:3-deoxy-manno-octulosonate cytidylyltransferase [Sedimentisphaerales bacterium]
MTVIAVIPARYESSRFPGKVLAKQTGKYLIQHVYERVCEAALVDNVLIATDAQVVAQACDEFGGQCCITRKDHNSGTDRVAEAVSSLDADIIINVQGDEPEILPDNIDTLVRLLQNDNACDMATLCAPFDTAREIQNPNVVKVVTDKQGHALYFSRSPIPYQRDADQGLNLKLCRKHLGIYAYRKNVLLKLSAMPATPLELSEKLEQLRALENGLKIAVANVKHTAVGIDTPQQYQDFVQRYAQIQQTPATEK